MHFSCKRHSQTFLELIHVSIHSEMNKFVVFAAGLLVDELMKAQLDPCAASLPASTALPADLN